MTEQKSKGLGEIAKGLRVLDLTRNLAGPFCTMILGDLGAEVVKVEVPGAGDDTRHWAPPTWNGISTTFLSANRNKASIAINLDSEDGVKIVRALAREADVLVESFKPQALARRGLGKDVLMAENPTLIHCSISAFGSEGPLVDVPGYDPVIQAHTGLMSMTGEANGPPTRIGVALVDLGAGLWAAFGILAALYDRDRSGKGSAIETSLYETAISWLGYHLVAHLATGESPARQGSAAPMVAPYEVFDTAAGNLFVAAPNDAIFRTLARILGLGALAENVKFKSNASRVASRKELHEILEKSFREKTAAEWAPLLRDHGVPSSEVRTVGDVVEEKHLQALSLIAELHHPTIPDLRLPELPLRRDGGRGGHTKPPPELGEHTDEILTGLGYDSATIRRLREAKVVA